MKNGNSSKLTLSLIVPCYNEEATLENCIKKVVALKSAFLNIEVIIVDDCSKDRSLEIARKLKRQIPEVKVFQHEVNQGKGAAIRTGIHKATGDFIGIQDADLEYDPLEYRKLLTPLLENEADVVFGSRYLRPYSRKVLYFWHSWMNKTLTFVSNMFTNLDISDMETCYKLFRREIIQSIELKENRFGFEPEVVAKIAQRRCRVWEVAISYKPRSFAEGKKINWKDGIQALYCILHYSAHTAQLPMQLAIYFIIGGMSAVSNLLLFILLLTFGVEMTGAVVLAFVGAAVVNYLLCIAILFRHRARWNTAGEIIIYLLVVLIMGAFDVAITMNLTNLGISPFWSKATATGFGFIGNFILRRYIVFPEKSISD